MKKVGDNNKKPTVAHIHFPSKSLKIVDEAANLRGQSRAEFIRNAALDKAISDFNVLVNTPKVNGRKLSELDLIMPEAGVS